MDRLNHFDSEGRAQMVDVSAKAETLREAVARARISMRPETLALIQQGKVDKGDVLGVARVAGIMAAKKTADLIPMCHPLAITGSSLDFLFDPEANALCLEARIKTTGKTGVEMEALTAVTVAALTVYDMCKAVDRGMVVHAVRLVRKCGGKSGVFVREDEEPWGQF